MTRSSWKAPFVAKSVLRQTKKALKNTSRKSVIPTRSRASMVIPPMVGLMFSVHNGKDFIPVLITEAMVGHKLGEFSPTRKFGGHASDKKGNG